MIKLNFWKCGLIIGAILFAVSSVTAEELGSQSEGVDSQISQGPEAGYWGLSMKKLGRGVQNSALGWMELPHGIQDVGSKHGVGAAATWGILHGVGCAIQRTAVGVFEIVTFPIGVPEDFAPIIEPRIEQSVSDQKFSEE